MNAIVQMRRTHIIELALDARSEVDIANAICQLDHWLIEVPDDTAIRDAYGPLLLRKSAFQVSGASDPIDVSGKGREVPTR